MASYVFNIALGKFAYYASLPGANDALILIPLENAGLEADSALRDYTNVSALLAGSSNEQVTLGRKTITTPVATVDNTNNRIDIDFPDQTWSAASGNQIGAVIVAYDPDTTGGTDADLIPLSKHDFVSTPDGTDLVVVVNASGFARAQG